MSTAESMVGSEGAGSKMRCYDGSRAFVFGQVQKIVAGDVGGDVFRPCGMDETSS